MKAATAARVAGCAAQLRTFDALRPLPGILILIATISMRKNAGDVLLTFLRRASSGKSYLAQARGNHDSLTNFVLL